MSFSSLLPPPKHSKTNPKTQVLDVQRRTDVILKALSGENDQDGAVSQDNVFDSVIASRVTFQDFVPIRQRNFNMDLPKPPQSEIEETYNRTRKVFDAILAKSLQPEAASVKSSEQSNADAYEVEYNTKMPTGLVRSRVLKIVEHAQDPLQPSSIKASKVVAPTVEEPITPIFHMTDSSDTVRLSKEERDKWSIPAAISSWKNPNGYTISLEKRLGMDARYHKNEMGSHEVSEGFASLSNALEAADRKARQEIKMKAEAKRQLADEETREREEKLRLLAQKAREERESQTNNGATKRIASDLGDTAEQRDLIRKARRIGIERDLRRSKMTTAERLRELAYSEGRDVSEKVILGAAKATESSESHYDARLFSKAANAYAKRSEDQVYDNPLFDPQSRDNTNRANLERIDKMIRKDESSKVAPIQFTQSTEGSDTNEPKEYGLQRQ